MSLVKSIARRVARGVSRRAARSELFEKRGERAATAPLPEGGAPPGERAGDDSARSEPAGGGGESPAVGPRARLVGPDELAGALRPRGRPLVIHHWATWCAPCDEELPVIEALASDLAGTADVLGLSWELFDGRERPAEALKTVQARAEALDLSWPTLVFTGTPEELFSALEMDFQQIPQTRVTGADGACLEELHRPLSEVDRERIRALVGAR